MTKAGWWLTGEESDMGTAGYQSIHGEDQLTHTCAVCYSIQQYDTLKQSAKTIRQKIEMLWKTIDYRWTRWHLPKVMVFINHLGSSQNINFANLESTA